MPVNASDTGTHDGSGQNPAHLRAVDGGDRQAHKEGAFARAERMGMRFDRAALDAML